LKRDLEDRISFRETPSSRKFTWAKRWRKIKKLHDSDKRTKLKKEGYQQVKKKRKKNPKRENKPRGEKTRVRNGKG